MELELNLQDPFRFVPRVVMPVECKVLCTQLIVYKRTKFQMCKRICTIFYEKFKRVLNYTVSTATSTQVKY